MQGSCHEQNRVALAAGEDQGGEEHDDQTKHHREIVSNTVDDVAAYGIHENLGQKTFFTWITLCNICIGWWGAVEMCLSGGDCGE